jgi:PAS domain S-box-containing protein
MAAHLMKQEMLAVAQEVLREGKTKSTSLRSFSLDAETEVWARIHGQPITVAEEVEACGALLSVADSTQEMLRRKDLELQESFYESLMSSIPLGLIITDRENLVIGWNPGAARLFKISESEALGRDFHELNAPLFGGLLTEEMEKAAAEKRPSRFVVSHGEAEQKNDLVVTYSPLRSEEGEIRGGVLLVELARP